MNLKSPDWLPDLTASLSREFGDSPKIASLATVDQHGHPQTRCIVIRELDGGGSLWFITDTRSEKVIELAANRNVQVLVWLASPRLQYRLSGEAQRQVDQAILQQHWVQLSDASRAMFFWGLNDSPDEHAKTQTTPPSHFAVYRVWVTAVDFLSLNSTPHEHWQAYETNGWKRED